MLLHCHCSSLKQDKCDRFFLRYCPNCQELTTVCTPCAQYIALLKTGQSGLFKQALLEKSENFSYLGIMKWNTKLKFDSDYVKHPMQVFEKLAEKSGQGN